MTTHASTTASAMNDSTVQMASVMPIDPLAFAIGSTPMGPLPTGTRWWGPPMPAAAPLMAQPGDGCQTASPSGTSYDRGEGRLPWDSHVWQRIDKSVASESRRAMPASYFLPRVAVSSGRLTIDSDLILTADESLDIDEAATFPLIEIWSEFALTPQQVEREMELATACTLARRSANILAEAMDLVIFRGDEALRQDPLFRDRRARFRSGPAGTGLFHAVPQEEARILRIAGAPGHGADIERFGDRTYQAVTEGRARLESKGHYGPYALILETAPFADTCAPLAVTLATPAALLQPMMDGGFYETGSLPPKSGLLISVGGNSMDLVIGCPATVTYLQQDAEGKYIFRVYQRFALRLKDETAILKLLFEVE